MNCRTCETWLQRERDNALTPGQEKDLAAHVATCPACRMLRRNLEEASILMRMDAASVAVPDADAEWRRLHARLHSAPARRRLPSPWWVGAPLAAAAALALAFVHDPVTPPAAKRAAAVEAPVINRADYVEAGDPNAATMVYVDKSSGWLVVWASDAAVKDKG